MAGPAFKFTQTNSTPYSGLDGTVIISDGTATTDKLKLIRASGFGMDGLAMQTQKAPFQQGSSLIRTQFDSRTISLECAISVPNASTTGYASVTTIKRSLSRRLSPVGMGFLPDTSLSSSTYSTYLGVLSYASDGVTYDRFIDVVPMSVEYAGTDEKAGFQRVRFVFFCPDPFWYGATQSGTLANVSAGISGVWRSVVWAPELGIFCGIAGTSGGGSNLVQTSPDGITWMSGASSKSGYWYAMTWSPALGLFCAVSLLNADVQTSPDGINWTLRTGALTSCWDITWAPELGIFCATGFTGATNTVQTSPDGINWTTRTSPFTGSTFNKICWSSELRLFCVMAQSTTSLMTSPDGINWTTRTGAYSGVSGGVAWSPALGLFCAVRSTSTNIQTSPDGINWTLRTGASSASWSCITWAPELGIFCALTNGGTSVQTSPDGINWTLRTGLSSSWQNIAWAPALGIFCSLSTTALQYPEISYDGINWVQNSATTDWYISVPNSGDMPIPFRLTVPIVGGETGKVVAVGENFLWDGAGDPPSDHNMVISTDGLPVGEVVIDTTFGAKSMKQFGQSILNNFQGGTFFSFYVTGTQSNILYVRNTGTPSRAPSITWRNRYISV
jgi:hypothetical protein